MSCMSLLPLFDSSLLGLAAKPALECERPTIGAVAASAGGRDTYSVFTFGDLEVRSNQWGHVLQARGLRRGDRLAFFLSNRVEIIDLWLAAVKLGLIVVPINVL